MLHIRKEEEGIVLDLDVEKMRCEDETGSFSQQEVLLALHQSRLAQVGSARHTQETKATCSLLMSN